jgi:hypothetical protein
MYRGTLKFAREQIVFVAETVLVGALDMIESGLPTSIDWQDRTEQLNKIDRDPLSLGPYDCGALEAAGEALSIFYAQLTGDGLGCYDALHCAGEFHKQVEAMVRNAWFNEGKEVKAAIENRNGLYRLEDVIPNYPDCRKHAEKFAEIFDEYLSPWEPDGVPLDADGRLLAQWPDTDADATIRVKDEHGNNVEIVRRTEGADLARWNELRALMPDDALYFQPDEAGDPECGTTAATLNSFDVYRDFENAEAAHPDCEILAYSGADIEEPTFLDVEQPKLFWNKAEA